MRKIVVLAMLVLAFSTPALCEDNAAGSIKNVSGSAFILRQGQEIPATQGVRLYESDGLRTESDGALGIYLRDDTVLSFGPNTEVKLENFLFDPIKENFSFTLRIIHGTAAVISGAIGRLAPDSFKIITPQAMLGVKGTHFLVEVQ